MRNYIYINKIHAILLLMAALLLAACSDDSDTAGEGTDVLQMAVYTQDLADEQLPATTRAGVPSGYSAFTSSSNSSIGVFMTPEKKEPSSILYDHAKDKWQSFVSVTADQKYYIYGYMPAYVNCNISKLKVNNVEQDYANGTILTFANMQPVMAEDICVISGVQHKDDTEDLTVGKFDYLGKGSGENYVNLLFDHICSSLLFKFMVDPNYSKLRIIKLKEVKMKTEHASHYTATVTMKNDSKSSPTIAWAGNTVVNDYVSLFTSDTGEELSSAEFKEVCGFFVPQNDVAKKLVLQCTYDVYEKIDATNTKLLRENCTATNKLPIMENVGAGKRTVLNLTIAPTYLYVLGDEDLDNPTVTISP